MGGVGVGLSWRFLIMAEEGRKITMIDVTVRVRAAEEIRKRKKAMAFSSQSQFSGTPYWAGVGG